MLRSIFLWCIILVGGLGGCSSVSWEEEPGRDFSVGTLFDRALEVEYLRLATAREAENDWDDVRYFRQRAQAAARGDQILPQSSDERSLSEAIKDDVFYARQDLLAALNSGGRAQNPIQAARAQAAGFDCWVEALEEGRQPGHITQCKDVLKRAMAALGRVVDSKEELFTVHFRSSFINPKRASRAVLRRVVARWKERGAKSFVAIVGHTDTAGDPNKNLALSQKRAERVASILARYGLDPKYMVLEAYGEEHPTVSTGRNTSRSRNRRVEIRFKNVL